MSDTKLDPENDITCAIYSPGDVVSYLEGFHEAEAEFAEHLTECAACRKEVAFQRSLASVLARALDDRHAPAPPPDFARKLTVAAESNVSKLRSRREITIAGLIIVSLLFLLSVLAATGDVPAGSSLSGAAERLSALASVAGQLLLNLSLSIAVIFRSLTSGFAPGFVVWPTVVLGISLLVFVCHRIRRIAQSRGA